MKFVFISDTHMRHKRFNLGSGDVLVHCGDAEIITDEDLDNFGIWFSEQKFTHKIFVPGNHDFYLESDPEDSRRILNHRDVDLLLNDTITINGLKIYGSPYVSQYGHWAFMLSPKLMKEQAQLIPMDTDLLITHGPPKYILDQNIQSIRCGCDFLAQKVVQVNPIIHAFGHIHESYGVKKFKDTFFVNAAVCPSFLDSMEKTPIVVELEDKKIKDYYFLEEIDVNS